jgi:hypothetical protein
LRTLTYTEYADIYRQSHLITPTPIIGNDELTLGSHDLLQSHAMIDTFLIAGKTVVSAKGDGPTLDVSGATGRVFLLTLEITKIVEQESLEVSIHGSADGAAWGAKAVSGFPQKFYCGESPLLLDLTAHPDVKFVRAHWEVGRWGRGTETPMFEFGVRLKEIPADVLREATAEAKALA